MKNSITFLFAACIILNFLACTSNETTNSNTENKAAAEVIEEKIESRTYTPEPANNSSESNVEEQYNGGSHPVHEVPGPDNQMKDEQSSIPTTDSEVQVNYPYVALKTIGGNHTTEMEFEIRGDLVAGQLFYNGNRIRILVLGKKVQNTFYLKEYDKYGNIVGNITLTSNDQLTKWSGEWSSADYENPIKMKCSIRGIDEKIKFFHPLNTANLSGTWGYKQGKNQGKGEMQVYKSNEIYKVNFSNLGSSPSNHIAAIEEATVSNPNPNRLIYDENDDEFMNCKFEIVFYHNFAVVSFLDDRYECGFGMQATVEGFYIKK